MQKFAHYYSDGGYSMNSGDTFWAFLMTLLLIGLLGSAMYFLFKRANGGSSVSKNQISALDEAKKRYAKGEITKAQLDEIRKELKK